MVQERAESSGKIRLALVGCGQIGRLHAERIVADGRGRIVALCDPLGASAARLQSEFAGGARLFADVGEMAAACPLDAALVCTPTNQHFHQVQLLRDRGVPVLCEKPLADSRQRIVQLIAEGHSNKAIASTLNISLKTVETHRASVMRKLSLSSSAALVRYAIRNKIVEA